MLSGEAGREKAGDYRYHVVGHLCCTEPSRTSTVSLYPALCHTFLYSHCPNLYSQTFALQFAPLTRIHAV